MTQRLNALLRNYAVVSLQVDAAREAVAATKISENPADLREQVIVEQMQANLQESAALAPGDEKSSELAVAFHQLQANLTAFYGGDYRPANARSSQVKANFAKNQLSLELAHALNSLHNAVTKAQPPMS